MLKPGTELGLDWAVEFIRDPSHCCRVVPKLLGIRNSDCGPVLVEESGTNATFIGVTCGDLIKIQAQGVALTNCSGKLLFIIPVELRDCRFEIS